MVHYSCGTVHRRRKGGGLGAEVPPRNDITPKLSFLSGAENRDKDRDTLIEQSL